MEGSVFPL